MTKIALMNEIEFIGEWENQTTMEAYMHSEYFKVLHGAMKVLTTHWKIDC